MRKLLAIITVLALAACGQTQQRIGWWDIMQQVDAMPDHGLNELCSEEQNYNIYTNQTKPHTRRQCKIMLAYLMSNVEDKNVADAIYKLSDKKWYPVPIKIRGSARTDGVALDAFLMGVGAGLANQQTAAPRTNRVINCTTTSTGYLTNGLITNCYK